MPDHRRFQTTIRLELLIVLLGNMLGHPAGRSPVIGRLVAFSDGNLRGTPLAEEGAEM